MLSITGIYGLSAYTVSRRTREIGLRMAIGADSGDVLRFVFGRLGTLVASGTVIGVGLGAAGSTVLASVVHQATPRDPAVLAATGLSMTIVALAAALGPAWRAMRVDPVLALRNE